MNEIAVIKCGGSIIDNLPEHFFESIRQLQQNGVKPIVVHGGGPAIKDMLDKLDVPFTFIDGLRTTSAKAMNVVEMVLSGHINNAITRQMNAAGIQAAGFSGSDANLITCIPKDFQTYGYVGDVVGVNASFLKGLLEQHIVPVVAPIAVGKNGSIYNVNADTAAGHVAEAIHAGNLIFMTDVPGVMQDGKLLTKATDTQMEELITKGIIYGGMIPKVKAALACLNENIQQVMIADVHQTISDTRFRGTIITRSKETITHDSTISNL